MANVRKTEHPGPNSPQEIRKATSAAFFPRVPLAVQEKTRRRGRIGRAADRDGRRSGEGASYEPQKARRENTRDPSIHHPSPRPFPSGNSGEGSIWPRGRREWAWEVPWFHTGSRRYSPDSESGETCASSYGSGAELRNVGLSLFIPGETGNPLGNSLDGRFVN